MPTATLCESTPASSVMALRSAVLVVATPTQQAPRSVRRWHDETAAAHRTRLVAADGVTALGFPELSFHRVELALPVLAPAASAIEYVTSLDGATNCGHGPSSGAVRTIRLGTMDDEAHHALETCEENGCPTDVCEGRAHIDCERCVRDPLIEPYLKRCEWCRRDGVTGDMLAAVCVDGVVVLTSQCAPCGKRCLEIVSSSPP